MPTPKTSALGLKPPQKGGYIVSPWFDHLMFIWSPLWFLAIGLLLGATGWGDWTVALGQEEIGVFPTLVVTFSLAHIFAVFFRSHMNPDIFKLHPLRFVAVPLALLLLFWLWDAAWVVGGFVIIWADNYHSSMQTFGLGRLYDMRAGNPPQLGRRLDMGLALVIFIGPILSGLTLLDSLDRLEDFASIGLVELARFPGWAQQHQLWFSLPIIAASLLYIAYYCYAWWRLAQRGYRVSPQKVMLYGALATTSLVAWGFGALGQAFLVMESFHSLQYFGIVWWSEQGNLQRQLRLGEVRGGRALALAVFLGLCLSFGLWVSLLSSTRFEFVIIGVCELMHYWYDGFIWSVRKKQVA